MPGDESRKARAFRLGVARQVGASYQYKPAATVGLAADGGVFVSPKASRSGWRYGVLGDGARVDEQVEAAEAPKLHYHRSGLAAVSLTGRPLEFRSLKLSPLGTLGPSQIFSISVSRTWELSRRTDGPARGDMAVPVRRWPDVVNWSVYWVPAETTTRQRLLIDGPASIGLLSGETSTHGVVSLAANGHQAILLITVSVQDMWDDLPLTGGTTVTALPERTDAPQRARRIMGLWSARLRNPLIHWNEGSFGDLQPASTVSAKSMSETFEHLVDHDPLPIRTADPRAVSNPPRSYPLGPL